jgi:acetyl esterase/lipase
LTAVSDTHPNTRGIPRAPLPPEPPVARSTTARHTRAGRAARLRPWIALGLAAVTLFLAVWIVIPSPNRLLLPLSVGAPEISVWLLLMAIVGIIGALRMWRLHFVARIATAMSVAALLLALWPLMRFRSVATRADLALRTALGDTYLDAVPFERQLALRPSPLILADLFRGLPSDSVRETKNVLFATVATVPLHAIVYQPLRAGTYPVIVQIYGGAWQRGTPDDFAEFARFFASRGYVVFAVDYRHAPRFRFSEQTADVRTALAWVRKNAAKYDADTSRIALLGRSAGAHLALMTAYDSTIPRVRAVVGFYAPVDLVDAYRHPPSPDPLDVRDVETKFIGAGLESALAMYERASPINHVRGGLPPTLLLNGARDNIVEMRYGQMLDAKLRASGDTSVLVTIPWADHAFDTVPNGPSGQLSRYVVERFLAWALTRRGS